MKTSEAVENGQELVQHLLLFKNIWESLWKDPDNLKPDLKVDIISLLARLPNSATHVHIPVVGLCSGMMTNLLGKLLFIIYYLL
eukprot:Pgem_evm1s16834